MIILANQADDIKTIATVASATVALVAMFFTYAWGKRHKEIDVTMHFQTAWDGLEMLKPKIKTVEQANAWFYRYWNLQLRQYEYWLRRYIRDEIYTYWMQCRMLDYQGKKVAFELDPALANNSAFPGTTNLHGKKEYTFRDGWIAVRTNTIFVKHPYLFTDFIDQIMRSADEKKVGHFVRGTKISLLENMGDWLP